jgi:hypothetical protein
VQDPSEFTRLLSLLLRARLSCHPRLPRVFSGSEALRFPPFGFTQGRQGKLRICFKPRRHENTKVTTSLTQARVLISQFRNFAISFSVLVIVQSSFRPPSIVEFLHAAATECCDYGSHNIHIYMALRDWPSPSSLSSTVFRVFTPLSRNRSIPLTL